MGERDVQHTNTVGSQAGLLRLLNDQTQGKVHTIGGTFDGLSQCKRQRSERTSYTQYARRACQWYPRAGS